MNTLNEQKKPLPEQEGKESDILETKQEISGNENLEVKVANENNKLEDTFNLLIDKFKILESTIQAIEQNSNRTYSDIHKFIDFQSETENSYFEAIQTIKQEIHSKMTNIFQNELKREINTTFQQIMSTLCNYINEQNSKNVIIIEQVSENSNINKLNDNLYNDLKELQAKDTNIYKDINVEKLLDSYISVIEDSKRILEGVEILEESKKLDYLISELHTLYDWANSELNLFNVYSFPKNFNDSINKKFDPQKQRIERQGLITTHNKLLAGSIAETVKKGYFLKKNDLTEKVIRQEVVKIYDFIKE
jgi:hypothetical protein